MSMTDYEKKGGILGHGHHERDSNFDGCPKGTCETGTGSTAGMRGKAGMTGTETSSQSFLPGGGKNQNTSSTY